MGPGVSPVEVYAVTITGPKDAANVPVSAIQPSDETRTAAEATGKDHKSTLDWHNDDRA